MKYVQIELKCHIKMHNTELNLHVLSGQMAKNSYHLAFELNQSGVRSI